MRTRNLAAAVAVSLMLAGCATGGTGPEDDLLPVEVTDPADDLLPVESAHVSGTECLPGSWLLDNSTWRDLIVEQAAQEGVLDGVTVETPTGTMVLEFDAGDRYSITYDSWEARMQTAEGAIVTKANGTDAGQFSVTGSSMVLTPTTTGSVVQAIVETPSGSVPLGAGSAGDTFIDAFSYSCEDDVLMATIPEGSIRLDRQ